MSPRTGRPPIENPKSERLYIRVSPDEKKMIQEFTEKNRIGLLELIRRGMEMEEKKIEIEIYSKR